MTQLQSQQTQQISTQRAVLATLSAVVANGARTVAFSLLVDRALSA
jgi:hypothetical protein